MIIIMMMSNRLNSHISRSYASVIYPLGYIWGLPTEVVALEEVSCGLDYLELEYCCS